MLRPVMVLALAVSTVALAQDGMTTYREPSAAELKQQGEYVTNELKKGEAYYKSEAFSGKLLEERTKAMKVPDTLPGNKLEVPPEVLNQKWAGAFNGLEEKAMEAAKKGQSGPLAPFAFASLSMPKDSLKNLARDAVKAGGGVVFRGLKNDDFKAMRAELQGMGEGFVIDPTMYQRFGITEVPAFVMPVEPIAPCNPNGCPPVRFVKVTGNVTVEAALEYIRINSNEPDAKALADGFLKKLREK